MVKRRKRTCAWISRHKPTTPQRRDLEGAGYKIKQINPPDRIKSARDAWCLAQNACEGIPDICVVVMPISLLSEFLAVTADYPTVVVHAPARRIGPYAHDWEWTGEWLKVQGTQWSPTGTQGNLN